MTSESVLAHSKLLEARFTNVKNIPGTRSQHCFKPLSRDKLSLSRVSFDHDKHSTVHPIGVTEGSNENDQTNYTVGVYVATVYDHDRKWFVGMILERCEEKADVLVKFMHPAQSQKLAWPSRPDICWVPPLT